MRTKELITGRRYVSQNVRTATSGEEVVEFVRVERYRIGKKKPYVIVLLNGHEYSTQTSNILYPIKETK